MSSNRIQLSIPSIGDLESAYVADCMETGWISSCGTYVERLEADLSSYYGSGRHVTAVSSGTAALHLAMRVADIGDGDAVITQSLTFAASVNAIRYVGATPVFVDVSADTLGMDPQALRDCLETACTGAPGALVHRESGKVVRAVLAVHVLGHPAAAMELRAIADEYGLTLIEDAAEAVGSTYNGKPVGVVGDFACISFNGNKAISAGGGGALIASSAAKAQRARHLATQAKSDPQRYLHDAIGYNYRLTNLHAAIACAQIARMPELIQRKREIQERYQNALTAGSGVALFSEAVGGRSNYWLALVRVRSGLRDDLMEALSVAGIESRPFWYPLHRQDVFCAANQRPTLPTTDLLHAEGVTVPTHAAMTDDDVERVICAINRFSRESC